MKKRILALLMALMMMIVLAACGGGGSSAPDSSGSSDGAGAGDAAGEASGNAGEETGSPELEGEKIEIESDQGHIIGTIVIPEGWSASVWASGHRVTISGDQGEFGFSITDAMVIGVPEDKATQLGTETIASIDCRWQVSGDNANVVEFIGNITGNYYLYISSEELTMTEPDVMAMMDSITITVKE